MGGIIMLNNELEMVIERFALKLNSSITKVEQIKDPMLPDKVYDVYRISTEANKEYILKLDRRGYEYMVYKQLFETKRLPVPSCFETIGTDSGSWMLISDVGNQTLVKGELDQYLSAARSLATLHSQLAEEVINKHEFLRNKANKIATNLGYLKDDKELPSEIVNSIIMAGERLLKRPFTVIHDDLIPINMIVDNNEVFFIDWELASYGCYAHDLGRLLGDLKDDKEEHWVNPSWKQSILKAYYDAIQLEDKLEWKDFALDFDCACIWNYAEIVIAHLRNDWERSPWYHANVKAISQYKPTGD